MTSVPTKPYDVPPYQLQSLIARVVAGSGSPSREPAQVRCAQAFGSEVYVGCSSGELLRFALQADDPNKLESYSLLSRQSLSDKSIDEIALIPSISRALILSDRQIYFYTLPSLNLIPSNIIKPIRNVVTFAVDHQHLKRSPPSLDAPSVAQPIDFCVIKRSSISLFSLSERLHYRKEIPLPTGATLARRSGRALCIADKENYNMVDLEHSSLIAMSPLSQAPGSSIVVKPSITVINESEFLIASWTGGNTIGIFVNGDGDPVRGTLQWPAHPQVVCFDYPYIFALLPNKTIEIHSLETQEIVQVVSAPSVSRPTSPTGRVQLAYRLGLVASLNGYMVPSNERSDKMRMTSVPLFRQAVGT